MCVSCVHPWTLSVVSEGLHILLQLMPIPVSATSLEGGGFARSMGCLPPGIYSRMLLTRKESGAWMPTIDFTWYFQQLRGHPSLSDGDPTSHSKEGFSEEVVECIVRFSSPAAYQARWGIFCRWCLGRKGDPFQTTVPLIAEFPLLLFQAQKLTPGTVRGYRAVIANILSCHDRPGLGTYSFSFVAYSGSWPT